MSGCPDQAVAQASSDNRPIERVLHSSQSHRDEWASGPAPTRLSLRYNSPSEARMPDTASNTQTIATFLKNSTELLDQLNTDGHPITLVAEGHPIAILQSPAEYQRLRNLAAEASADEGIRQGLEDVAAGRVRPAQEVFDELREKYRIPR